MKTSPLPGDQGAPTPGPDSTVSAAAEIAEGLRAEYGVDISQDEIEGAIREGRATREIEQGDVCIKASEKVLERLKDWDGPLWVKARQEGLEWTLQFTRVPPPEGRRDPFLGLDVKRLRPGLRLIATLPDWGYKGDQEHGRRYLAPGGLYTVEKFDIGNWRTTIWLKEIPGVPFNSVHFDEAPPSLEGLSV